MKTFHTILPMLLVSASFAVPRMAASSNVLQATDSTATSVTSQHTAKPSIASRLTLGGYGEAVMTRNFYSDAWQRYTRPEQHSNDPSHGRFDIPHVVLMIGYDFGRGWTMGSEIEFEHGGTESAVEMEAEETGEYESEIERGGEVALEQFWIQKSFNRALNLRMGHIIVPVGMTNQHHLPTEYFTVYRPEGENTIFPCTWHETGISLWGRASKWRYEVMFLPGLDSDRFGSEGFIHDGAGSPYEFKIANAYAGALRIDNYSIRNLRLSVSGYYGSSFSNSLTKNSKYSRCHGEVMIGSFDFMYKNRHVIARGNFDWAHLNDSREITEFNRGSMSTASPSPKTAVGSDAVAAGVEAGYDVFSALHSPKLSGQQFWVFGHYEYYDSMAKVAQGIMDYNWCGKHRIAVGVNYYPLREIAIKAEFSKRFYQQPYNNEPSISIGIVYAGYFLH
ncbi:MAG: hypothetical protein ACI4UW_03160 [Muribaculaceae bacterium]